LQTRLRQDRRQAAAGADVFAAGENLDFTC
jgi:hypothetical protein